MKFEFAVNEVDYIVKCLAQRPWNEVNSLMKKFVDQSNDPHLNPPQPVVADPKPH